jgi:hypothetical protein
VDADRLGVFPPGARLLALPSWRAPRLVLSKSGGPIRRWRDSAFYPATRSIAKLYRLALRSKAILGCGEARPALGNHCIFREFVDDCLPTTDSMVLQTRPPSQAQKFTIELRDRGGTILGYVKYGTQAVARRRLEHEYSMLARIPAGLGPTPLKLGNLGDGTALIVAPLYGRPVASKLRPAPGLVEFAKSLEVSPPLALAAHPYVCAVQERVGARLDAVLEDLAGKIWPVSLTHGDLVPWNLRQSQPANSLSAFDWEYGIADGFPYVDLAYFILQVAVMIYSWPPVKSAIYATTWLEAQPSFGLNGREARALVRLSMFDAYCRTEDDGAGDDHPLQSWRRRIWRGLW